VLAGNQSAGTDAGITRRKDMNEHRRAELLKLCERLNAVKEDAEILLCVEQEELDKPTEGQSQHDTDVASAAAANLAESIENMGLAIANLRNARGNHDGH
jgi:hypothetical protein